MDKPMAFTYAVITMVLFPFCARTQVFRIEHRDLPQNRTMSRFHAFYIFSIDDAPDASLGKPYIKFVNLKITPRSSPDGMNLTDYRSVQLHVMKYSEFWHLVSPQKTCCAQEDITFGSCLAKDELLVPRERGVSKEDVGLYSTQVGVGKPNPDKRMSVGSTGVYIVFISNCGQFVDGYVDGMIVVRNPYGFLPGDEYYKMPFYGWLLCVYAFLTIVWLMLSVRWRSELHSIQNCIAGVIVLGLFECLLWYIHYKYWNSGGNHSIVLFMLSILFGVAKNIFSYMLVLVAALGWGVTRSELNRCVLLRIQALSFFYIVFASTREAVLALHHGHALSIPFVLLCLVPVSLLNGAIFFWIFMAMTTLMETLSDTKQFEKLALFTRLWRVLVFSVVISVGSLFVQMFSMSRRVSTSWKYQWLFDDAISHILFLVVLAMMMYLWAPSRDGRRYAYAMELGTEHNDEAADDDFAADNGLHYGNENGDSFWGDEPATTRITPAGHDLASVIGVERNGERV